MNVLVRSVFLTKNLSVDKRMEQSKNLHKNPKYSRKTHCTAGSIWIISSLCLFANFHVIPSVSGLYLSFAANENGVVNIQFNKKAELNISINVDSTDFGSESSGKL